MNVYDFDKTILDGDSTTMFVKYCLSKKPLLALGVFGMIPPTLPFLLGFMTKTRYKELFYEKLLPKVDVDALYPEYFEKTFPKVKKFYLEKQREDDVIISASSLFMIKPFCDKLGIRHVLASDVDKKTGKTTGENCSGEEKVRRFTEAGFRVEDVEEFYSDSLSDTPMANTAKKAYVVTGEELTPWEEYRLPFIKKCINVFFDPTFFRFAVCGCINTVVCVLLSYLLSFIIPNIEAAHLLGYFLSISLSYFINSAFSFKKELSFMRYLKFIPSYIPNYLVQLLVVFVTCDLLQLPKLLGLILAAAIGAPVTFLCMKFFAFRK